MPKNCVKPRRIGNQDESSVMVPLPVLSQSSVFENSIRFEMNRALNESLISSRLPSQLNQAEINNFNCGGNFFKELYANVLQSQSKLTHSHEGSQLSFNHIQSAEDYSSKTVSTCSTMASDVNKGMDEISFRSFEKIAPLLQQVVRRALSECLSTMNLNMTIEGELNVLLDPNLKTGNANNVNVHICNAENTDLMRDSNSSPNSPNSMVASQTISKRKSYQPQKYFSSDVNILSPENSTNPINISPIGLRELTAGYVNTQFSGSTSPSTTDSGALDLSRGNSISGSAPITPMKSLSINHDSVQYYPYSLYSQANILELYKNHLFNNGFLGRNESEKAIDTCIEAEKMNSKIKRKRLQLPSDGNLSLHSLNRRSNVSRRFPCNQCQDEFTSLHCLEDHTVALHGSYRCHICKAQFTQRSNLQRHALKHVGFKPFECRVCRKAYYRKDHLMRHMEMGHPGFSPRDNITVHLTSSESLEFLNRNAICDQFSIGKQEMPIELEDNTQCDTKTSMSEINAPKSPNSAKNNFDELKISLKKSEDFVELSSNDCPIDTNSCLF